MIHLLSLFHKNSTCQVEKNKPRIGAGFVNNLMCPNRASVYLFDTAYFFRATISAAISLLSAARS